MVSKSISGINLFSYCESNPIVYDDINGYFRTYCVTMSDAGDGGNRKPALPHKPSREEKIYAATVYAEAGGQNKTTKQAVAHVMNNRIGQYEEWNSIEAVISAPSQFDGYNSELYYSAMQYYDTYIWDNPIERQSMDECLAIVIPIYNKQEPDFTGGALYFHSFPNPEDWLYHYDYELIHIDGTEGFWFYR